MMFILLHSSVGADALSVGIVGGGPSGASFAGRLREAFGSAAEITVFEAKGHLGGQAQTLVTDGVVIDRGTRYILKSAGRSVLYDEVTAFLQRHAGKGQGFTPYAATGAARLFNGTGAAEDIPETDGWQDALLQFGQQVAAYEKGARAYLFSRAEHNAAANFSSSHPSVRAYMNYYINGQLYGPDADVSAHSLYTWLAGFESFGSLAAPLQVEGGFGPPYQNLFASVGATIRLNSRVANVTGAAAGSGQNPTVLLESGEAVEFDAVVVTLPLDTFPTPLEANIGRPLGAFADTYVSSMSFSVAGGAVPRGPHRAYTSYPSAALATVTYDGTGAYGGRQFFAAAMYEPADTALNESMSITRVWPEVSAMTQFVRGQTRPLALADVQVTPGFWERYRYNVRFSADQLARGVPRDIHRAQGQSGVWYGGGALSHWNVGDILEQASQTVARMAAAHGSAWTHQTVGEVASRSRVAVALSGAWGGEPGPVPRVFFGRYELKSNPLVTATLVEQLPGNEEAALMATLPAHFLGNGGVVGVGVTRLRNMELTAFGTAYYAAMQPQEGYYLALHENGVVRFHVNVLSLASAETLLAGESKGVADAALNEAHQMRYGDFCFGVFRLSSAGGASIQRYNRWAEAVDPYYVMNKDGSHTACAADEECPVGWLGSALGLGLGLVTLTLILTWRCKIVDSACGADGGGGVEGGGGGTDSCLGGVDGVDGVGGVSSGSSSGVGGGGVGGVGSGSGVGGADSDLGVASGGVGGGGDADVGQKKTRNQDGKRPQNPEGQPLSPSKVDAEKQWLQNAKAVAELEPEADLTLDNIVAVTTASAARRGTDAAMQNDGLRTMLDVVQKHVECTPDHRVFTWVDKKCCETKTLTYRDVWHGAGAVAKMLIEKECSRGDRVMIAYPFGLEFLAGMFGCMRAGIIPCSIYPPNPNKLSSDIPKFEKFARDAGAKFALSTGNLMWLMRGAKIFYSMNVQWLATDKLLPVADFEGVEIDPEDIGFIQYTSGSTGVPKGVMISHRSLLMNAKTIAHMTGANMDTTAAMWAPQYHDMGLIGGFMTALFAGPHTIACSPLDFIQRPLLWTEMVERYQAHFTCAPNFAFALLLRKLGEKGQTASWSHVRCAIFGGEPTDASVVERLQTELGMPSNAVWNMYGMAECGLCVTAAHAISLDGLVSCGPADLSYATICIVVEGRRVADGELGSIWVRSALVASGYWGQPELTDDTFQNTLEGEIGQWLDTGDLGMLVEGELYVTGRLKDVIIIQGKNYYPTDLERTIDDSLPNEVRPGSTAAFQHGDGVGIVAEARKGSEAVADDELLGRIRSAVQREHGAEVVYVRVLRERSVPKTTSGKLQRNAIRECSSKGDWTDAQTLARWVIDHQQNSAAATQIAAAARMRRPSREFTAADGGGGGAAQLPLEPLAGGASASEATEIEDSSGQNEVDALPSVLSNIALTASGSGGLAVETACRILTEVTGSTVDPSTKYESLGLTSMQVVQFRDQLSEALGVEEVPMEGLMTAEGTMDEVIGKLELESPTSSEVAAFVVSKQIGVAVGEPHDRASATATGTDNCGGMPAAYRHEDVELKLAILTAKLASLSPRPLPVPLYLALEAVLIVALQLANALPLCAALLGASFMAHHTSALIGQMLLPLCFVLAALLNMLATVVLKWVVLGRVQPGEHPLHGWWHLRYWFIESRLHCHDLLLRFLVGTPLYNVWLRLLGAHIGAGASVNTLSVGAALDLLTIGAGADVSARSISCHHVPRSGVMVIAPMVIGARATIGPMSIVMPGAIVGEATVVGACSVVERALPPHTFWAGQPLQKVLTDPLEGVTFVRSALSYPEAPSGPVVGGPTVLGTTVLPRRRIDTARAKLIALRPLMAILLAAWLGIASVGGFVFGSLAYFPRAQLTAAGWDSWGVALILVASFFWVWQSVMLVLGVLLKWLLVGRRKLGVHARPYPLYEAACSTYHSILSDVISHQTPYILQPPALTSLYLRLCGAKIGRRVIIRNPLIRVVQADSLCLRDGSFFGPSTLRLQLPVRDEATLKPLIQSSSFELGEGAITCPKSILATSIGYDAVALQNTCLPSVSGPLPSSMVYMGAPPTAKQWSLSNSLKDHATLRLGCGMVICFNVMFLLMSVAMSLLPVAAIVAAIHSLPVHIAQHLAASAGSCNSPAYVEAYHITSFELGHIVEGIAAWCDAQTDGCSIRSFLSEMGSRVYEQADPARSIGNQVSPQRVPCRADGCAHFDDDLPDSLPRCISNVSRMEWCPEVLLFLGNARTAEVETLPPCVMDVLIECTQQATVTAMNWVPTSDLVPLITCARLSAEDMLTRFSWREPLETLQSCVRLMVADLVFYLAFLLTALLWKRLLVGRFQSGAWDFWDLRSNEWIRQFGGSILDEIITERDHTLTKALNGSQWRVVIHRLSGMRVGKRVFVDRDAILMDEDLILLEDGVCVGFGAYLAAHEMTRNGKLKRGPVIIGADSTVGPSARLTPYVTVEAGSNVPALVCALPGQTFRRRS